MTRRSYRVKFDGGGSSALAGIVDLPAESEQLGGDSQQAGIPAWPVLVFSHCFTCNKDLKAIVRIARGLADRGIAVLRFDMTGLGGSEGDFSQTNFTTNIADLNAAIEFANEELGHVTALMGHSFGGAASLAVAGMRASDPSRPAAIIALAAPSETTHLAMLLERMDPAIATAGMGEVSIGGRTWSIRRQMLEDFRSHDLPRLISQIQSPTLLFHSPVDRTVNFDHALRIQGLIQNSQAHSAANQPSSYAQSDVPASLITLRGADHLLVENPADIEFVTQTAAAFVLRYAQPPEDSKAR